MQASKCKNRQNSQNSRAPNISPRLPCFTLRPGFPLGFSGSKARSAANCPPRVALFRPLCPGPPTAYHPRWKATAEPLPKKKVYCGKCCGKSRPDPQAAASVHSSKASTRCVGVQSSGRLRSTTHDRFISATTDKTCGECPTLCDGSGAIGLPRSQRKLPQPMPAALAHCRRPARTARIANPGAMGRHLAALVGSRRGQRGRAPAQKKPLVLLVEHQGSEISTSKSCCAATRVELFTP